MILFNEFLKELYTSDHLDNKHFLEYLKENAIALLGSDYIDDMSNEFSNKYDLYNGSFEGLVGDLMENGVDKVYNRLQLD